ncbi:MAG: DUF1338 domain-containing protein, partial [Cyclobacteriaceae bacterium]
FRTFNMPEIGIEVLARIFKDRGYEEKGEYHFEKKKLFARHFEHQTPDLPLIFISELKVEELSQPNRQIIHDLVAQTPQNFTRDPTFIMKGRPWNLSFNTYQQLKQESEYAAWMAAFGFRVNHFTVSVNQLKSFNDIRKVNQFLQDNGFALNTSGGEVKGTAEQMLEQSSTIAYNTKIRFSDGEHEIPACYYEFAKRYPKPNGQLFRGFIAGSADKIFESTDKGQ